MPPGQAQSSLLSGHRLRLELTVSIAMPLESRGSRRTPNIATHAPHTTLVRNLRPLQRDGFVNAVGGGRGNRVELTITAKGRKQLEKLTPAWKSAQSAAVKTLGEKRWSAILSDLETAALALEK